MSRLAGGGIYVTHGQIQAINNSTVSNNTAERGGGIYVDFGTTLAVTNSTVSGNHASLEGGGIYATRGSVLSHISVTMNSSTVSNNVAQEAGGGIFAAQATSVIITSSLIRDNVARGAEAQGGGGIRMASGALPSGALTLTNSIVRGNYAGNAGGGISTDNGDITIDSSTLSQNRASQGGGIFVLEGELNMTKSILHGNRAFGGSGGALLVGFNPATANLTNVTVSGNTAIGNGGGIITGSGTVNLLNVTITRNGAFGGGGVFRVVGPVNVKNTIIAQNRAHGGFGHDANGAFTSQGHNLVGIVEHSTGFTNGVNGDQVGTDAAPLNARLAPLANNGGPTLTHALRPGSPALDRGDNTGAPASDQRGVIRPQDGDGDGSPIVDVGAFEAPPAQPPLRLNGRGEIDASSSRTHSVVLRGSAARLGRYTSHGEVALTPGAEERSFDGVGVIVIDFGDGDRLVGTAAWELEADGTGRVIFSWRDSVQFDDGTVVAASGRFAKSRPPGVVRPLEWRQGLGIIAILIGL